MDVDRLFNSLDQAERIRHLNTASAQRGLDNDPHSGFYQGRDAVFGLPLVNGSGGVRRSQLHTNVQSVLGQPGVNAGGFDVGSRRRTSNNNRRQHFSTPDAKQLILMRRDQINQIWVRSQTEAIKIYEGGVFPFFASLSSTGAKITDFIVTISAYWTVNLGQLDSNGFTRATLIRWDGLVSTVLFRAGFLDLDPSTFLYPTIVCVAKRGFWVSVHFPNDGLYSGPFPSYWQVGKSVVQETSCSAVSSSGVRSYTLSLASDDYGSVVTQSDGEIVQTTGRQPVGLGAKKSGVRLLYDHDQQKFLYVRFGLVLGEVTPPTSGLINSLDSSNTCFDEQFLYFGQINPLDINEVIQSRYPIAAGYQDAFKVDTPLDFFEIPLSAGLTPFTLDPRLPDFSSLEYQDDFFAAIAFDLGERLIYGSLSPASPNTPIVPPSGGGGS